MLTETNSPKGVNQMSFIETASNNFMLVQVTVRRWSGVQQLKSGSAKAAQQANANPDAARRLSVLSLPTTFVFDADGRQRYRASGVPTAADLRSALQPLLA